MGQSIELYKQDRGDSYRDLYLDIGDDGRISLNGYDINDTVRRMWDSRDYEYRVEVAPEHLPKLLTALVDEHFAGCEAAEAWLADNAAPEDGPQSVSEKVKALILGFYRHRLGYLRFLTLLIVHGVPYKPWSWNGS